MRPMQFLFLRSLRRYFAGAWLFGVGRKSTKQGVPKAAGVLARNFDPLNLFREQSAAFASSQALIQAFYAIGVFLVLLQFPDFIRPFEPQGSMLLWPVVWLRWVSSPVLAIFVVHALWTVVVICTAAWSGYRWLRILTFIGWLEEVALRNSLPKIGHSWHLVVLVSFILIFLPKGWNLVAFRTSRWTRHATLLAFWTVQAAILLSYTLSGLGKVIGGVYQGVQGQPNAFSVDAFARQIAERLWETDSSSIIGQWFVDHPWVGSPLMPLTMYVQLFAFWIAFRPSLQRPWAVMLIFFHIASYFSLTIHFPQNCLLLALFFFRSPFAIDSDPKFGGVSWSTQLFALPGWGCFVWLFGLARRGKVRS